MSALAKKLAIPSAIASIAGLYFALYPPNKPDAVEKPSQNLSIGSSNSGTAIINNGTLSIQKSELRQNLSKEQIETKLRSIALNAHLFAQPARRQVLDRIPSRNTRFTDAANRAEENFNRGIFHFEKNDFKQAYENFSEAHRDYTNALLILER